MLSGVKDRKEELILFEFSIREFKSNEELISSLESLDTPLKKDGTKHKGKVVFLNAFIKRLKAENKMYKKFFNDRKDKPIDGTKLYPRYKLKVSIERNRKHLYPLFGKTAS